MKKFILDYAHAHCCGDYGWALSMLIGPVSEVNANIKAILEEHEARIVKLEQQKNSKEKDSVELLGRQRFIEKEEKKNE